MTPFPNAAQKLATSLMVALALVAFHTSCNRKSTPVKVEQSSVPSGSSTTPAPCSVEFNGHYVNDVAEVLDAESENRLEQKLDTLKSAGQIDFSVVTIKTTNEQPIADYSLALARCWNVGGHNPDKSGLLLLLAVNDRKWHMQISRAIERVLSNDEIQTAGSRMTPHLRQGNYAEGINECVDGTINTIAPRRGFSMGTAKE